VRAAADDALDVSGCSGVGPRASTTFIASEGRRGRTCGNGRIDFSDELMCAPCMPDNTSCPCVRAHRPLDVCDEGDLARRSCTSLGYRGGELACSTACDLDTSRCVWSDESHRFRHYVEVPVFGEDVSAAIALSRGTLGVAWRVVMRDAERAPPYAPPVYGLVFGRTDPTLTALVARRPFALGYFGPLRLAGNDRGWLVAAHGYGDAASTHVFALSRLGVLLRKGAELRGYEPVFLVRSAVAGPSLLGIGRGVVPPSGGEVRRELRGVLLDDEGQALGEPFQLGADAPAIGATRSVAAALSNGEFAVARGGASGIDVVLVSREGVVRAGAKLDGASGVGGDPLGLVAHGAEITMAWTAQARPPATFVARIAHDGTRWSTPRRVGPADAVALLSAGASSDALLVRSGLLLPLEGDGARAVLGAPHATFAATAIDADGAFVLVRTPREGARVYRLL
jgi:hypothetical protein